MSLRIRFGDSLVVRLISRAAGYPAYVRGSVLTDNGDIVPIAFEVIAPTAGTTTNGYAPVAAGELLSLWVSSDQTALTQLDGYAVVLLQRGSTSSGQSLILICSGYIGSFTAISWPGNAYRSKPSLDIGTITSNELSPAAGAAFIKNYSSFENIFLLGIKCTLTTSATVATRRMSLTVLNNPRIIAATTQLASLSREYSFLKNITEVADTAGGYQSIPLPSMDWVMDQYVSIDPINMQVDDQLSSITISLKRMVAPTALVIT